MANGGRIDYTIGFNIDKSGLNQIYQSLSKLQNMTENDLISKGFAPNSAELNAAIKKMDEAKQAASSIGTALQKSFNTRLNTVNLVAFEQEINKSYGSVQKLFNTLNKGGIEYQQFAAKLAQGLMTTNTTLKKTETIVDKIGGTLARTLGWSLSSSVINRVVGTVQNAIGYVEHLDASLNDIRIVTKKSSDEMANFAVQANEAAKALGKSTTDYTEASLIYYQQGLSDKEVAARAETTLKVANVTGQATSTVSEELTAVWNGYKVSANEAEEYIDKLSAVAATTASDLQELSTGMSKVASAANSMGVDIDQLNAQLATIVSVTRQAPESVGTALKTIYARMSDLTLGGSDEDGVDLGKVSGGLANVGIDILDETGELRELGVVIEEVADHWNDWTVAQQAAIAQLMAGKRQYNNLVALFDNWGMYEDAIETSQNATGELQRQQDIYMQSTKAHLQQLKAQWEDVYDSILDPKTIIAFTDGLKGVLKVATDIIDVFGGGGGIAAHLAGLIGILFSDKMASGLSELLSRASDNRMYQEQLDAQLRISTELKATEGATKTIGEAYGIWGKNAKYMSEAQIEQNMELTKEIGLLAQKRDLLEQDTQNTQQELTTLEQEANAYQENIDKIHLLDIEESQRIEDKYNLEKDKITLEYDERKQKADEEYQNELDRIQKIHDERIKAQDEEFQDRQEKAAQAVKNVEANLAANNAVVPKTSSKTEIARTKDFSDKYSTTDLINSWSSNDNDIQKIKNDLSDVIQSSDKADKAIKLFLNSIPDRTVKTSGGLFVPDEKEWDKWSEKGVRAVNLAIQELDKLKNAGKISDEDYKKLSNDIANAITKEGTLNKNNLDKVQEALENIQQKAKETSKEFKDIINTLNQVQDKSKDNNYNQAENKQEKAAKDNYDAEVKRIEQEKINDLKANENNLKQETKELDAQITQELKEQNKALEDNKQKQEEASQKIEENKKGLEETKGTIESTTQAMTEQNKVYEKQATMRSAFNLATTLTAFANSGKTIENFTKSLVNGNATIATSISQISSLIFTTTSGISNLGKLVDNLSSSSIPFLSKAAAGIKGISAALGPVALIIGGLYAGIKITQGIIQGNLDAAAKAAENAANAQEKFVEFAQEENDAINELSESYNEILKARQDGEELSDEQKNQIYDLISAYGNEELMLLALAEDYDGLAKKIKEVQTASDEALYAQSELGKTKYTALLKTNIEKNASSSERDAAGYDFTDAENMSEWANDLAALIGKSGEDIIDDFGHIGYDDLVAVLTADEKALNDFIRKYNEEDATQQIVKLLAQEEQTIEKINSVQDNINTYNKESAANSVLQNSNLETAQGYYKAVEQTYQNFVAEGIIKEDDEQSIEEGRKWIKNFFKGVQEGANNFDKVVDLADAIFAKTGSTDNSVKEQLVEQLGSLSNSQLTNIAQKSDTIALMISQGKTAKEIFQDLEGELKELTYKDHSVNIKAVLNESSKKKVKENIDELFSDKEFAINIGISKESFMGLDKGLQEALLVDQQFTEDESNVQTAEQRKADIEKTNAEIDAAIQAEEDKVRQTYEQMKADAAMAYNSLLEQEKTAFIESGLYAITLPVYAEDEDGVAKAEAKYEEFMNILANAYLEAEDKGVEFADTFVNAYEQMDEETKEFADSYIQNMDAWGDVTTIESWGKAWADAYKKQREADQYIEEQAEKIRNARAEKEKDIDVSIDYASRVQDIQTSITNLNKTIDELQSSYQSLQAVVEDYNKDGYLTLDNLQKILEMDDAYVASLQLENGQLSINDETYGNLIQTELHLMEVKATELYLDELRAIAQGENVTRAAQLDVANQNNVATINAVTEAAREGVDALYQLADAKAAAEVDSAQTKAVTEAYYNRMQLIKNVASQGTSKILSKAPKSSSSSSGSKKEPKTEKYLEREEDIYREINEQLKQIESTLGRIQKINDHEWGYDAQVTLEKENELLDLQLNKLEEKKKLQENDLSSRRKQLEDIGVNFSDDGSSMSNAEAVLNGLYAHYNQMVDTYNKMSVAEQETYKKTLDAEKERIDKIDKKISGYESLYSEYQSTLDDILDKHFEQIENTVNQFNNMVEVHLELDDAKKEWTDFWYDVVKDVEENNFAEQIAKSMSKLGILVGVGLKDASGSQVAELTRHTAETVAEVSKQIQSAGSGGNLSIFGDDSKLAYETLKDYRDKLMTALEDAEKEVDRVGEVYLQILDDAQDKIDKQVESWNAIGDQLQNNIDLITLVSGDDSYAALAKQFELQYNNNLELVETQRRSKEYWQQEIDKYKSLLASTKEGSKEWKTYSAALEKSTENFKNAVKDLGDTVQKSIEELYKWKKSQIAELEDAFDKGLSNGMGLSDLEDEWSLINESADRYFDQVERSLAMEDINLTFDKLLNNTSLTAEAQKELNKLRDEEISRLEEKDKLNQFDIDELKARLEITKQQMALEDAQRAKTNLRLRRDSQGNYSYQYTADESQIADQAEGLLSAKKDWYELVKKRQLDLYNSALDIRKRLSEKYKELNETDWTNNLEGRQRLLEEIKRLEQLEVDIMRDAEDAKQLFFKGTADYFKEVEDAGMFPQWQSTLMKMGLAWNDGGSDSFIGTVNSGISQSEQLVLDFGDRVNEILTRAGIDYANLRDNGIDPTIDALDDLTDSNEELAESLDETNALLDQQAINLKQVEEAYNALKTAAVEAVESANKVLEELSKTAIETQQQVQASVQAAQNAAAAASRPTSYNRTTGTGVDTTGGGPSSGTPNKTDNVLFSAQGYDGKGHSATSAPANARNTRSWIMSAKSTWPSGSVFKVDSTGKRIANVGGWSTRSNGQKIENLTELLKYITTYRSGGYTGTWGGSSGLDDVRSGRLAVLHEKELVLNKDDTKNLLDAVSVLRGVSISQVAEGIIAASRAASTAINGVGAGLMQTIAGLTQNVQSGDTNTYSRNMTVNADFSGVKSAEAIYQALMELDNYGMQNAYSNAPHMNRAY